MVCFVKLSNCLLMNHINIAETYRTRQNNAKPCRTLVRLEEPEKTNRRIEKCTNRWLLPLTQCFAVSFPKMDSHLEHCWLMIRLQIIIFLISFEEESSVNLKHKHSTAVIKILFQRKLQNQFGFYICSKFSVFKSRIWALDSNPDREVFTPQ